MKNKATTAINKNYKPSILKLELIKNKLYKTDNNLELVQTKLKKALQVIYKFHKLNKRILFVNSSFNSKSNLLYNFRQLIKKTNHVVIDQDILKNSGMLTVKIVPSKKKIKNLNKSKSNLLLPNIKLKKTFDLLVLLTDVENQKKITGNYIFNIPVISIKSKNNSLFQQPAYSVINKNNFNNNSIQNNDLFYLMLKKIFKK